MSHLAQTSKNDKRELFGCQLGLRWYLSMSRIPFVFVRSALSIQGPWHQLPTIRPTHNFCHPNSYAMNGFNELHVATYKIHGSEQFIKKTNLVLAFKGFQNTKKKMKNNNNKRAHDYRLRTSLWI